MIIESDDEGTNVTGSLDLLVFKPEFWVLVIEAKKSQYSLEAGLTQALAYMLGSPNPEKPALGFVTNGIDFIFLKLTQQGTPESARSERFDLDNSDGL